MTNRLRRHARRRRGTRASICCCHGLVYTITDNMLGIIAESADAIISRLQQIDGVKVVEFRGRWCDLMCPPLRLPDVARVLVPLDSARAPAAMTIAAQRGRIW